MRIAWAAMAAIAAACISPVDKMIMFNDLGNVLFQSSDSDFLRYVH